MWFNCTLTGKIERYDICLTNCNAFFIIKIPYPTGGIAHEQFTRYQYVMGNKANYDWLIESKAQLESGKIRPKITERTSKIAYCK